MGQIWSIGIQWVPGTGELEIEQLQEAAIVELKRQCPHIELGEATIQYGPIRDQPTYDEDGNEIPVTVIFQELKVECERCAVEEHDGMG